MNELWSKQIQGIQTLYLSRKVRFNDLFQKGYESSFKLDKDKKLKILEIGCGPGALAAALHRWYPNAEITAIDRDSNFINFAKENHSEIYFVEGDATHLPFDDDTFDVTISNTVSEHIEPNLFYEEQKRVLKTNGVCLVLYSRTKASYSAGCLEETEFEKAFWSKLENSDDLIERYGVGKYRTNEKELPQCLKKRGFRNIESNYVLLDLTVDNLKYPSSFVYDVINAKRMTYLESLESINPQIDGTTSQEIEKMQQIINHKFDRRIALYNQNEQQWDTDITLIQVVRGIK